MKKAKNIEAVLCVLAVAAIILYGLWTLRPEPRGVFTGEGGFYVGPGSHSSCDVLCQIILGYIIAKTLDATGKWFANGNTCGTNCGGGGGGGFGSTGCEVDSTDICRIDVN